VSAGELAQAVWLKADETRSLMSALDDGVGTSRFVGGVVRNALMGESVGDIDIATTHTPERVMELLAMHAIRVVPTGLAHGTVTAILPDHAGKHKHFEITTLRVDVATDGRRAEIAFTQDWLADAKRRDFTMNALCADMDGVVHDPLGEGRADLDKRRVRFIGDARARIEEDYLRILRFFRFHAWYGKGELNSEGLRACADLREGLTQLSGERVQSELLKILAAIHAPEALRQMAAVGVLPVVLPEAHNFERFERLHGIETDQLFANDPLLRLIALLNTDAAGATALAARLRLSNKERERMVSALTDRTKIVSYLSMREVRRALYQLGTGLFRDRVLLEWAQDAPGRNAFQWRALVAMADSWHRPQFPLTGQMLKTAGVPEGPQMGMVMREVEEWWIDADFIDDPFSIIERLKAVVQATIYE
jgi:poly(A) polymerase